MTSLLNIAESVSQVINTIHAGEPNETFSARVANYRNAEAHWYWRSWIWMFDKVWPGHLDWAAGPDTVENDNTIKIKLKIQRHIALGWRTQDSGEYFFTVCRRGLEAWLNERFKTNTLAEIELSGKLLNKETKPAE